MSAPQPTNGLLAPSYDDVVSALVSVIRPTSKLVVVHSQIGAFGPIDDPAETLLSALYEALPLDATLAMPVFTFNFLNTRQFNLKEDTSETGMLTETFRLQKDVHRTKHPIYSYALKGPLAEKLSDLAGETCWGDDTFFATMENLDADIVMLGNSWEQCTLFHRIEQIGAVEYRYAKEFSGTADFGNGSKPINTEMLVRRLDVPVENDFSAIVKQLERNDAITSVSLGRGLISSASARDILTSGQKLLKEDPLCLLADKPAYIAANNQTRVALLGSTNLDTFDDAFMACAEEWLPSSARTHLPPFDQYRQEIINPESEFHQFDPEWIFFLERAEDVLGTLTIDLCSAHDEEQIKFKILRRIDRYAETILQAHASNAAQIVVLSFDMPASSPLGMADQNETLGQAAITRAANEALLNKLDNLPGISIIDFATIASGFGRERITDLKYWYLGRIPFSRPFSNHLAGKLVGFMLALTQKTARLIVTDLDNTLWGGVIGEEGVENISIGTDFPGNAFRHFQITLKALSSSGIALAICSKNTEPTALSAFSDRPEMILSKDDFVARRINWKDKANNIREMAKELGLGLGSICFLDDDPHQRALVRRELPEVFVPELPEDPARRSSFVLSLPCLERLEITKEDFGRTKQYKARATIEVKRRNAGSLDEFYRELAMKLSFEKFGAANQARIIQLIAKTNQFNTTTHRYGLAEITSLLDNNVDVLAIGLADKFSEHEIIGVLVLKWEKTGAVIDLLVLSCRVLGRSVEQAILGWVCERARQRNVQLVEGTIIETPRNQPVRSLFADNGFTELNPGIHQLDLGKSDLSVPDWFFIEDQKA